MQFQTSVLKQRFFINDNNRRVLRGVVCAEGDWERVNDFACLREIKAAGWILPKRFDGLILVFSTTPVEGASTTNLSNLFYAGWEAQKRAGIPDHLDRKLWWWPMIVTNGDE